MALSAKQQARLAKLDASTLREELKNAAASMGRHNRHSSAAHQDIAADLEIYMDAVQEELNKRESAAKGK